MIVLFTADLGGLFSLPLGLWLDDRVTQNLHWDGYGEHHQHQGTTVTVPGIMEGWHTFVVDCVQVYDLVDDK